MTSKFSRSARLSASWMVAATGMAGPAVIAKAQTGCSYEPVRVQIQTSGAWSYLNTGTATYSSVPAILVCEAIVFGFERFTPYRWGLCTGDTPSYATPSDADVDADFDDLVIRSIGASALASVSQGGAASLGSLAVSSGYVTIGATSSTQFGLFYDTMSGDVPVAENLLDYIPFAGASAGIKFIVASGSLTSTWTHPVQISVEPVHSFLSSEVTGSSTPAGYGSPLLKAIYMRDVGGSTVRTGLYAFLADTTLIRLGDFAGSSFDPEPTAEGLEISGELSGTATQTGAGTLPLSSTTDIFATFGDANRDDVLCWSDRFEFVTALGSSIGDEAYNPRLDYDLDGDVTSNDLGSFNENCLSFDLDCDGFITGDDFDSYTDAFYLGAPAADSDANGFVNGDDYDIFLAGWTAGC